MPGTRILLAVAAALLALTGAGLAISRPGGGEAVQAQPLRAGLYNPPAKAPDFILSGSDGSDVTLARYRGKVILLTFGFTYCAAVCPTTLSTLAQVRKSLGTEGDSVQVVFVTVDPKRDTAAQLADYLRAFDRGFIGATGDPAALDAVREKYGVTAVQQGDGPDYAMAHTSSIFLIDGAGKLRAMMPFGHEPADFVHDIRYLLAN